jgi:Trypsin
MKYAMIKAAVAILALSGCASSGGETAGVAEEDLSTDESALIGGATDLGHAYVVAVGDDNGAFCTGTVVSRRVVLTAGHCFGGITRVYFGTRASRPTRSIAVTQEIRHPRYNDTTLANDVTVLALESDALVQPAPLLRETMANTADYVGSNFTFVGYGLSNGQRGTGFGVKRVTKFPIAAVGPARVGGTPGSIDATQFYYRTPGKNTCNGDSGGPAFLVRNGVELHAGVTSFGDQFCTVDGVQQKTDLPMIQSFLQPLMDRIEGGNACRNDGQCNEACNTGGQVADPDCHATHCGRDGVCSRACASDPDCN